MIPTDDPASAVWPIARATSICRNDDVPGCARVARVANLLTLYSLQVMLRPVDKSDKDRWYHEFVPLADRLYDEHLAALKKKG